MRLKRLIGPASRKHYACHHATGTCLSRNVAYQLRKICFYPSIQPFYQSKQQIQKTLKGVGLKTPLFSCAEYTCRMDA